MSYTCIRQHDITDCGAACLAMISKHYGLRIPISKIREIAGTDKRGTNVFGMVKAAEQLGFSAKSIKGDREAFFTGFPLPSIAHVVMEGNLLHYVVIYRITKTTIVIADPSKGLVKYAHDDFFKIWTGVLICLVPDDNFQKRNETRGTLSKFFRLILPQKALLLNIFLASLMLTTFGILASFYFRILMDEIVLNSLNKTLHVVSVSIVLLYVFKSILEFFRNHLMLYLSQKIDIPLILGYYQHVLSLPMSFFGTRKTGEIISRFMDASKIREAISGATLTIMVDMTMAIVGGVVLYFQSSLLFMVAILMLFLYAIVVAGHNKSIKKINEKVMEENSQVTSYLVESLNGIETIKAFNAERNAQYNTERLFIRFLKSIFKSGVFSNSQRTLTSSIAAIGETVILWIGTASILSGKMTMGELITFNALMVYFLEPIKNLINLQPTMQTAIVAAERLTEILELSPEDDGKEEKRIKNASLLKEIAIEKVDFRYGTRDLILKNICMRIQAGEKVAFVGGSGSGKTTLVKLLMNFYNIENGTISFGNYSIKDINKAYLRSRMSYVSQDVFLFSGTIRENLIFGNADATFEDIIEACTLSRANEFIEKMPLRYETQLSENGSNLSGGQKQRLAIARALLKNPDILIMDEATSNLDSITEKSIENTINTVSKNITTIIIAHRLSTIMRCDKIFVFDSGRIIEVGSHLDLMKMRGTYYNLWKEQIPTNIEENTNE